MSILGIVNLVIFVLMAIKFGFGKAIGYVIGNFFIGLLVGIIVSVVCVLVLHLPTAVIPAIVAISQLITAIIRIKGAVNDLR